MGILSKLFKKTSQESKISTPENPADIKLENIVGWIESSNSVKIEHTRGQLEDLWADVVNNVSSLQSAIKNLEKAKFEPTDRTYAAINMTKDTFAKKSTSLNKIPKSFGRKFSEIESAYKSAFGILSDFKDANMKQGYIISNYFKEEAGQMVKILKRIEQGLSEMEKIIHGEGKILELVELASIRIHKCKEIDERLIELENNTANLSDSISKMVGETKSLNDDLKKLLDGGEWGKFQEAKTKLQEIEQSIEKVKYDFSDFVSALNRPIKKILHDGESLKLTKEQKNVLSSEIDIENLDKLNQAVGLIDSLASENKINLKIDEAEKISKLKRSITSDLSDLKEKYGRLIDERKSAESFLAEKNGIEKQKKQKELKIMSIESEISKSIFERDSLLGEKNKRDAEKASQIQEFKKMISETLGKEINLV